LDSASASNRPGSTDAPRDRRGRTRRALGGDLLLQLADGALQAARGQFEGVSFARGHRHRPNFMQRNI
jgi:hypothetical protein